MSPTDPGATSSILPKEAKAHIYQSLLKTQRPELVRKMENTLIEKVFLRRGPEMEESVIENFIENINIRQLYDVLHSTSIMIKIF